VKFDRQRLKSLIPRGAAKEIAERAGISAPSLSQYMSGEREPGSVELAKVAGALGVSMDIFFPDLHPQTLQALREYPEEHFVDDVIAQAQEVMEQAKRLEMMARKLKPSWLTEAQKARNLGGDVASEMARRGIEAGDSREVKPKEKK
jgi:transcriptional regulator with XRE-family HTH domain